MRNGLSWVLTANALLAAGQLSLGVASEELGEAFLEGHRLLHSVVREIGGRCPGL